MNTRRAVTVLIILLVLGSLITAISGGFYSDPATAARGRGGVGLIRVEGAIAAGGGQDSLTGGGFAGSDSLMSQLKKAREDGNVKALVIRVNSPGGTAAASQEIGEEIKKVRQAGKKVVISMGDIAASGGYWISASADHIFANPGTQTGSIGVIMQIPQAEELMRKVGLRFQTIKSGPHKDIGALDRDLTPEEHGILQGVVNDIYDQFLDVVAEGRRMSKGQVRQMADGRIFSGRQAKGLGLVDSLGNLQDALDYAAQQAGLGKNYEVIPMHRANPWERLLSGLVVEPEEAIKANFLRWLKQEPIGIK